MLAFGALLLDQFAARPKLALLLDTQSLIVSWPCSSCAVVRKTSSANRRDCLSRELINTENGVGLGRLCNRLALIGDACGRLYSGEGEYLYEGRHPKTQAKAGTEGLARPRLSESALFS